MARNDYHYIVCKILRYLYDCLKNGVKPDLNKLQAAELHVSISYDYFDYIWRNLSDEGYVTGVCVVPLLGRESGAKLTPTLQITPKGIEYLEENGLMKKAWKLANSARDFISIF